MTTQIQTRELDIRGISIFPVPQIDNHRYDEARADILRVHNERFRGDSRIADTYEYKKGRPLTHSNTPRALSYEQRAKELGITEFHVLSPKEVVKYWKFLPEKNETYADTNSISLYPNPSQDKDNESLRQRVLEILGMKEIKGPFTVSGLDVFPAENKYGSVFAETESTRAEEAPYLERDGCVKYGDGKIVSCDQADEGAVRIWVPESQSGLRGLFCVRSDGLDAGDGDLLSSNQSGRVQIFYDPQGRAENLEARLSKLQEQRDV